MQVLERFRELRAMGKYDIIIIYMLCEFLCIYIMLLLVRCDDDSIL